VKVPNAFNWLGLAETVTLNAHTTHDAISLEWARVADAIYNYLNNRSTPAKRDSLMVAQMNLRVAMIRKFGVVPGDPILDADQVVQWFLHGQRMSLEEADQKAASWQQLPTKDIRELRAIKNRISVIKTLIESGQVKPDQRLNDWLVLWNKLP